MCNGHNHPGGCECGFGPPYPAIEVEVRKFYGRIDKDHPKVADINIKFPIAKRNAFPKLDDVGNKSVLDATAKAIQPLADNRFGEGRIRVIPTYLEKGSIEIGIVLMALAAIYKFVKDYPELKKGVSELRNDIASNSKRLNGIVRRKYRHEEKRMKEKEIDLRRRRRERNR